MIIVIALIVICFIGTLCLGGREPDWENIRREDEFYD